MEKKYDRFKEYAEKYSAEKFKLVKSETIKRKKLLPQLAYLFSELSLINSRLFPIEPCQKTDIKYGIISAYQRDDLIKYFESDQIDNEFSSSVKTINDRSKLFTDNTKMTATSFVQKNQFYIPFEFSESCINIKTKDFSDLTLELVSGIVYSEIMLKEMIEDEVIDLIHEDTIGREELEELKALTNNKIKWTQKANEFAYIMQKLIDTNFIDVSITNSFSKLADLFHAHFHINGKAGNEATVRSLEDSFENVSKNKISKDRIDRIKDIFF
jgi:hypothetical protein